MLRTDELDFELPPNRVAMKPAEPRESAKLMVVWRDDPERIEHCTVADLPRFVEAGDVFVLNRTRVLAARFVGRRADTGGRVEGLYLRADAAAATGERRWVVLLKGKSVREGIRIDLDDEKAAATGVRLETVERHAAELGAWSVRVWGPRQGESDQAVLQRCGRTPLPPYILKARKDAAAEEPDAADRAWYSTSFDSGEATSVAAPTAGFHLTGPIRELMAERGARFEQVELAVGVGTFRPVETEFLEQHVMHREWCSMSAAVRGILERCKAEGDRVICVGTTAARTVESFAGDGTGVDGMWTQLLITPGYRWRLSDGLLTNFHLPRSTLLAMVASLFEGGLPRAKALYTEAIAHGYRFFSYGDAMLILPGRPPTVQGSSGVCR